MKITEYGAIRTAGDVKRRGKAGGAASTTFADLLDAVSNEDAQSTGTLSDVSAPADINTMLSLQEISDEEIQRKKAIQQGKNLIDELEKLRSRLLIGSIPLSTLQNLTRQLSIQKQSISDPNLMSLIDDIELRAAVELAKLEKAVNEAGTI